MKRFEIKVTGKVQGVYYRQNCNNKAKELGLTGFVMNMPDGSVYLEAEGAADVLEEMVRWCHRGPLLAKVHKLEVQEVPVQHSTAFEIRY